VRSGNGQLSVAGSGETCTEVGLGVLEGAEHGGFGGSLGSTLVEHVGVCVDGAGQNCDASEVDELSGAGNPDLTFGADLGDAVAGEKHNLACQHLSCPAVEDAARMAMTRGAGGQAKKPPSEPGHGVGPAPRQGAGGGVWAWLVRAFERGSKSSVKRRMQSGGLGEEFFCFEVGEIEVDVAAAEADTAG
jgi:hypothetical protein